MPAQIAISKPAVFPARGLPLGVVVPRTDARLERIAAKVDAGERLSIADGEVLFTTPDLWTVCALANRVARRLHGDVAYYNINRHLNYSNICALSCTFCEFYRKEGQDGAYTRDMAYVREQVRQAVEAGATEMHCVGGLHPKLPWSYYPQLVSTIRDEARACGSDLHVKAFTAVEIVHLAKIARKYSVDDRRAGIRWVLEELKAAGLGSLPGGGAEVFDDRVHDAAYKGKIRSDVWLDVHRVAHEIGLNTNATLLYGHIETRHDRLVHMDMLRRAQDEALARLGYAPNEPPNEPEAQARGLYGAAARARSASGVSGHLGYRGDTSTAPVITLTRPGTPKPLDMLARQRAASAHGLPSHSVTSSLRHSVTSPGAQSPVPSAFGYYQTIIPLPFFPDGSELEDRPGPTGLENLRTLAITRLMLDNFPHVKAFWIMQTVAMAQLMLQSGADDIDGTVVWYDITKVGGASTHQEVTVATLTKAIRDAGLRPVERDTLYRPVKREGKGWTV